MVDLIHLQAKRTRLSGDLWWKLDLMLWPKKQDTERPMEVWWLPQTQEGQTAEIHQEAHDDDLRPLGSFWPDGQLRIGFEMISSPEARTLQVGAMAHAPG